MFQLGVVSDSIWFIHEGLVEVSYRDGEDVVVLEPGSYFGDISFILQIKNQYHYKARTIPTAIIYAIYEQDLNEIFEEYP